MAQPHNSEDVDDADMVIRRIDPKQHVVPDQNTGKKRLSSKAFSNSSTGSKGMSVDLKELISAADLKPEDFVTNPKYVGSVEFQARVARDCGLWVGEEPIDENPYHGEVWHGEDAKRFTKSQKSSLLSGCSWLVSIPEVDLDQS